MIFDLWDDRPASRSNPKKATKRFIVWWLLIFYLPIHANAQQKFVSLTLCSDRLLMAIAAPAQIAAMSRYSSTPHFMLDAINVDKPTLKPDITALLPYADSTILLNEHFYPQLVKKLKSLGLKWVHIDDNPKNQQALFALMRQLGELTGNLARAEALITDIEHTEKRIEAQLKRRLRHHVTIENNKARTALLLADSGVINHDYAQYQTLFSLLQVTPTTHTMGKTFSPEQLIRSNPDVLITLTTTKDYHLGVKRLNHPALQAWDKNSNRLRWHGESRYFYCFDHGIWRGAEKLLGLD